jgi:ArsR family transcriptional regulator
VKDLVKVFKAVADPNRIRILKMLQQKKMCVCELSAVLGITQPSVSRHLSMMRDAGLVRDERDGEFRDIHDTKSQGEKGDFPQDLKLDAPIPCM